jgi:CBS domain-containing protein
MLKMTATAQQILEFLQHEGPFDQLDPPLHTKIAQNSQLLYLAQENQVELLEKHKDSFFVIQNGQFCVKDCDGPIKHLSDGDYFGFARLLDKVEYKITVVVDSPGLVLSIPKDFFFQAMETPAFAHFFKASKDDALQNKAVSDSNSMWLYKPLHEVAQYEPITVRPSESIQNAAKLMSQQKVSSVLIMQDDTLIGIATDRDLRNRVVAVGLDTQLPIQQIMTEHPAYLTKNKTLFDAICMMTQYGINHLPVLDAVSRKPIGMVTNTDVSKQQRTNVLFVMSDLSNVTDIDQLVSKAWQIPQYLASSAKRAGDFDIAGKVLSQATDIMTRKLITFFQQEHGQAPMRYSWLVYGSQAREDQTMGSDQDNALLFEREPTMEEADYFKAMAEYVCSGLGKCGIKLCDGNIMASNPALRMSIDKAVVEAERWAKEPTPQAILDFNIFLDVRCAVGDSDLFDQLQKQRRDLLNQPLLLAALARNANENSVPLSMFQKFVYAKHAAFKDSIDLKISAVAIINNLVRLYALNMGLSIPSTVARLKNLTIKSGLSDKDRQNLIDIWLFLNRLRWRHQLSNNVQDNFVRISDLSSIEKHQLKAAFQAIHRYQQAAVLKFSGGIG